VCHGVLRSYHTAGGASTIEMRAAKRRTLTLLTFYVKR